jgi:nucleotide-binding universal stress UspA family protein
MIKNIVVAIDGSVPGKHAQTLAIDLAAKYEARLTLVHVLTHDHPPEAFTHMAEVELMSESRKPRVKDKENTYTAVARFLGSANDSKEARVIALLGEQIVNKASASASKAGVANVVSEIHTGDYANSILEVAKKVDADIIVLGRRGLSNLKGFVTGSVSHKVSQRADCSVLTVK